MYDVIVFAGALFVSVITSFYYNDITMTLHKHMYSIAISFSMTFLLYGMSGILTVVGPALFTWLLGYFIHTCSLQEHQIKHRINNRKIIYLCIFGWIAIFGHLGYSHIYYMLNSFMNAKNDIRTIHMLLVIKLTSFLTDITYNSYFSNIEHDKNNETSKNETMKNEKKQYPDLIEWFGYVFFIPSYFVGPTLQFSEYRLFITNVSTHHITNNPNNNDKIRYYVALLSIKGTILFVLSLIGIMYYSPFYLLTAEFAAYGLMDKLSVLFLTMTLTRCKFYFAWNLSEIAYIASGASDFVSHKGRNVHIMDIELPRNTYKILNSWNMGTNLWLKQYVYRPLIDMGVETQAICVIMTNLVSALWHGFYPGYYITFLGGGLCTIIGRFWRRTVTQYIENRYSEYPIVLSFYNNTKIFIMLIVMNLISVPFLLYSYENTLTVINNIIVLPK